MRCGDEEVSLLGQEHEDRGGERGREGRVVQISKNNNAIQTERRRGCNVDFPFNSKLVTILVGDVVEGRGGGGNINVGCGGRLRRRTWMLLGDEHVEERRR